MKAVKEKLYHFEETPPPGGWEKISASIHQHKVIDIRTRRKTKRTAIFTAAAAAVVILLISVVFMNRSQEVTSPAVAMSGNDSIEKNNEMLETIISAPEGKKLKASRSVSESFLKYLTIEGPEGEPVKISPKVATLIISADNEYPPKPVWDKQISEWQHIMLTSNVAPTSANLIDIIQQASNLQ